MSFSQNYGPLSISEAGGNFTLAIDESVKVGGGSVAGVVSASGQGSVEVEGSVLIDAGLKALASKYPSLASAVTLLQGLVDAELKNV